MLAGGAGTRMRPLTDDCPKPLLPLAAEPLIGYQLRRLAAAGVRDIVVSTGYLADRFHAVLGDGRPWGVRLQHCVEDEPLGTGGALRASVELLPDVDRVVVLNGDLLSSHDLAAQLVALDGAGRTNPSDDRARLVLHVREVPDVAPYGQVSCGAGMRVTGFAEKSGSGPGLANAGTYVADADLLRGLPTGRSSWERDLLPALLADGVPVLARTADGYFRDVGSPTAYRLASVDAVTGVLPGALDIGSGGEAYVAVGAHVDPAARLTGGCSVHAGAVVGARAQLAGTVVLPGARVGAGAHLVRCVVAEGASVAPGTVLTDSIASDSRG